MAFLRSTSALRVAAGLLLVGAAGCQAILGIDDTSFQNADADSGALDGSTSDAAPDAVAPNDAGDDAPSTSPAITFSPTRAYVNQGGEADVTVTLARNGFTGAATLALTSVGDAGVTSDGGVDGGGADGISVTPLTIPIGSNTGIIHVFASAKAIIGTTSLDLAFTAGSSSIATLPTFVGGAPGSLDTTFGISGVAAVSVAFAPVSVAIGDDDSVWLIDNTWTVLHYLADGTSDDTLNAKFAATLGSVSGSSVRVAVHEGFVWICGNQGGEPTLVKRDITTGNYDPTFFSSGKYVPKESASLADGAFTAIAFSAADDILLSGLITGPTTNLGGVVLKITGTATTMFVIGTPFAPEGIGVDPSGRIGVGGAHTPPDGGANLFGQIIDTSFHDAGLSSVGNPHDQYLAQKAVVTSASQVAIAATLNNPQPNGVIGAFATDGGTSGFFYQHAYTGTYDQGFASIAAASNGAMYVTDNGGPGAMEHAFITRVSTDGGADPTFAFSVGSPNSDPFINFVDLAVDSLGRVIAAGTSNTNLYLARVWP